MSIIYMIVTFSMCVYGLYLYGKMFKLEDIDQYLSKENQECLLKNVTMIILSRNTLYRKLKE